MPTIIFDLEWLYHVQFRQSLYHRYNQFHHLFRNFLQKIHDSGAQLVFVFVKNGNEKILKKKLRLKEEEIYHARGYEVLDIVEAEGVDPAERFLEQNIIQGTDSLAILFHQVAEKFGVVRGFYNVRNRSRAFYTSFLARERDTLAIASTSGHHLLVEGSWQFWDLDTLDLEFFEVTEYSKQPIWDYMRFTVQNVPLFLVIVDQRLICYTLNKVFNCFKQPSNDYVYENIRDFLNECEFPLDIKKFLQNTTGKVDPVQIQRIESALKHLEGKESDIRDPGPFEYFKNIYNCYTYPIVKNYSIHIPSPYLDRIPNDCLNYFDIVAPIVRKVMGILLKDEFLAKRRVTKREIEIRKRHGASVELYKVDPIYPDCEFSYSFFQ